MALQTPSDKAEYKDAKAQAKAAKAYAKAQRPWYRKKRFIVPTGFVVLIVVIAAASGSSDTSTNSNTSSSNGTQSQSADQGSSTAPAATSSDNTTTAAASGAPTAKLPITDGDWRLDTLRVKDDGLGDFSATGRITYTGSDSTGGGNLFTVTVFVGGKDVAVLQGSADDVQAGRA